MHMRLPGLITITVVAVLASVGFAIASSMYPWTDARARTVTPVVRGVVPWAEVAGPEIECADSTSTGLGPGESVCVDNQETT